MSILQSILQAIISFIVIMGFVFGIIGLMFYQRKPKGYMAEMDCKAHNEKLLKELEDLKGKTTMNKVNNIIKKEKDSFYISFHAHSKLADSILCENPRLLHHYGNYNHYKEAYNEYYKDIEIIQMWLIGDAELLAEVKWKGSDKE